MYRIRAEQAFKLFLGKLGGCRQESIPPTGDPLDDMALVAKAFDRLPHGTAGDAQFACKFLS